MAIDYSVHPINFNALEKGDHMQAQDLLRQLGSLDDEGILQHPTSVESDAHNLNLLKFIQAIRTARPDLAAHAAARCHGVVILTDSEAERHTYEHAKKCAKGIASVASRRAYSLNYALLNDEQRRVAEVHDRCLTSVALTAQKELRAADRRALLKGDK